MFAIFQSGEQRLDHRRIADANRPQRLSRTRSHPPLAIFHCTKQRLDHRWIAGAG
jgi:hypothetical protein